MSDRSDRWLFVGSYGSSDQPTIHICNLSERTGELRLVSSASGITNPSFLTVSPDGRHLYAVAETGRASDDMPGSVVAFRIATRPDALELVELNRQPSGGDHPCHVCLDVSGRWLTVSNYGSGVVAALPIGTDGTLGEHTAVVRHEGSGPHPHRQEGPHAHAAIFSPDGRFVVAADLGIDRLVITEFDRDTGSLTPHDEVATPAGAGPRHLAFHPDGAQLFVVNELQNHLTLYEWTADTGRLREVSTLSTLPSGTVESIAADIRVSADGGHVYVSNRGHDSIAVFGFDRGRIAPLPIRPCGGSWPRGLCLAPDGDHLLVANQYSDEVVVLPLQAGGSDVGEPVARVGVPSPTCVALMPAGSSPALPNASPG